MDNISGNIVPLSYLDGNLNSSGDEQVVYRGYSAYQIALQQGFEGSKDEWLRALVGPQGETGVSISDVRLNPDFTLTVTLDDGTEFTTDPIKGDKGDKGQKGDKGDKGDTGNGITFIRLNDDYSLTLFFSDGSYSNTTSVRGPQGEQGIQGIQGPKGDTGERGPQGIQGIQGIQGPKGQTGQTGPQGETGPAFTYENFTQAQLEGLRGPQGDTGPQGIQGETGPQGPSGENAINIVFDTDTLLINVNSSGRLPSATTIGLSFRVFDGNEAVIPDSFTTTALPNVRTYSRIKGLINTISFEYTSNTLISTTSGVVTVTIVYNGETYTRNIPYSVIRDALDAVNVYVGKDSMIIHVPENGILTRDVTVEIPIRVYDGTELVTASISASTLHADKRIDDHTIQRINIPARITTGQNALVSYTFPAEHRPDYYNTVNITITYKSISYVKNIAYTVVEDGAKGDKGNTGDSGVYVGTEEPSDENVNIWIDTDGFEDILTGLKYVKDDPSDDGGVVVGHVSENTASGWNSYAEGGGTTASATCAHAEGAGTRATGGQSHAEGGGTLASGSQSHAEGASTIASGDNSHAENLSTTASGACSHASGVSTIAQRKSQMVIGEYNIADTGGNNVTTKGSYIFVAGNGISNSERSNAMTLDWSGNVVAKGKVTVGTHPSNPMDLTTKQYVDDLTGGQVVFNMVQVDDNTQPFVADCTYQEINGMVLTGIYPVIHYTDTKTDYPDPSYNGRYNYIGKIEDNGTSGHYFAKLAVHYSQGADRWMYGMDCITFYDDGFISAGDNFIEFATQ